MDAERASVGRIKKIKNIGTRFFLFRCSFLIRTSAYFHTCVPNWQRTIIHSFGIYASMPQYNCSFINLFPSIISDFQFIFCFSGFVFFSCCWSHRRCAVNQKIIKLVFFTALAIGTAAGAVRQQKPQLATTSGADERDRRCPLQFDNQKIVFYPHETDCTQYYLCAENGTLVELQCPSGLEFDADFSVRFCSILISRPLE